MNKSGFRPDLWVHNFVLFACNHFYWCINFPDKYFIVLTCCSEQKWAMYRFLIFLPLNLSMSSALSFNFYVFAIYDLWLVPSQDGPFSIRALIWVHFKTVRYFSQPIFSLFSYLKNTLHNLDIEMCSAPLFQKYCTGIYFLHTQFCS